jgi:hypothetical protein
VVTHAESELCPQDNCLELATHEVVVTGHNSTVRIGPMCADHALERMVQASPRHHDDYVKVEIESII